MSASILVNEELQPGPAPSQPRPVTPLATIGLVIAILATALMVKAAMMLRHYTSLDLLAGAEVDFVEDLVGSSFQVKNPNAASSCGCGSSFSVA